MERINETTKERKRRIKSEIFQHAADLMNRDVFDTVTIRDFCRTAGITTSMFYRHFPTKESLLLYYFDQAKERFLEQSPGYYSLDINKDNLGDKILDFYVWYAEYTKNYGVAFCTNFFNPKNRSLNANKGYNAILTTTDDFIIRAMTRDYSLPDSETPERLSRALCAIYKGIVFDWCSSGGNYDIVECVKRYMGEHINVILHVNMGKPFLKEARH
jgi:AcrR family transcriptional regulator